MSKDKVVYTRETLSTKDYEKFKLMESNRDVDENHVKQLQKLMLKNGNLTYEFPIIVDKDFNVIDGQHRLTALKNLGWEVGYKIEDRATIDTVRAINLGNKNWTWKDVATSYSKQGLEPYTWFLQFTSMYHLNKHPALRMAVSKESRDRAGSLFDSGELEISDKAKAHTLAQQVTEFCRIVEIHSNDIQYALIDIMRAPAYSHERMIQKARSLGSRLPDKGTSNTYRRELEDMFNHGYPDDNKVRLF